MQLAHKTKQIILGSVAALLVIAIAVISIVLLTYVAFFRVAKK